MRLFHKRDAVAFPGDGILFTSVVVHLLAILCFLQFKRHQGLTGEELDFVINHSSKANQPATITVTLLPKVQQHG